jgi:hypothetical protein
MKVDNGQLFMCDTAYKKQHGEIGKQHLLQEKSSKIFRSADMA